VFFYLSQERKPYIDFIVVCRIFGGENLLEVVAEALLDNHYGVVQELCNLLVSLLEVGPILLDELCGMLKNICQGGLAESQNQFTVHVM